jgi:hypothetical protein
MLNCKVGPGKYSPEPTAALCDRLCSGSRGMSNHRLKCRNAGCAFNGMMEAKSDQPFVKKAFLDKALAKLKASGAAVTAAMMQVRCPKCGMRWRMRADQLH